MAARANEFPMQEQSYHSYSAQADVFRANLKEPIKRDVPPQAELVLSTSEEREYKYKPVLEPYRLDGLISYRSGYTQVAGYPSSKRRGFNTLATSVVEDLNVLDVLTADRVVGQIATTHPAYGRDEDEGEVPSVTFLGTRFENLRINGRKIDVEENLDILGSKPKGDKSYFEDKGVLSRVAHHYFNINRVADLPEWASQRFNWDEAEAQRQSEMKCSLFSDISGSPGVSFGHVIDLPHFGKIFLGELKMTRGPVEEKPQSVGSDNYSRDHYKYNFKLTMIRMEFGCIADGSGSVVTLDTNGKGSKGGPNPSSSGKKVPV